jgi:hypothetical protein
MFVPDDLVPAWPGHMVYRLAPGEGRAAWPEWTDGEWRVDWVWGVAMTRRLDGERVSSVIFERPKDVEMREWTERTGGVIADPDRYMAETLKARICQAQMALAEAAQMGAS